MTLGDRLARLPPGWRRAGILVGLAVVLLVLSVGVLRRLASDRAPDRDRFRDYYEFYSGADALATGKDLYSVGDIGYVYTPTLAFLLLPATWVGIEGSAWAWTLLNLALFAVAAWFGARDIASRFGLPVDLDHVGPIALIGSLLAIDKLRAQFHMQETDALMAACFVAGLCWYERRPLLAGLALGLGANIKYLTLIALPFFLLRREWRAAAALLAGTLFWALLPALAIGWEANWAYLTRALGGLARLVDPAAVAGAGAHVPSHGFGVSVTAFASKMWGEGGHTASSARFVAAVILGYSALCVAIYRRWNTALLRGRGGAADRAPAHRARVAVEWAGLVVIALVFSPGTNPRHLAMLVVPGMVAGAVLLLPRVGQAPRDAVVWAALFVGFSGLVLPPSNNVGWMDWASPEAWRTLGGPCWTAALFFVGLLYAGLGRLRFAGLDEAR